MKTAILTSFSFLLCVALLGQNERASEPRVFFSAGFVTPQFYSGTELMHAYDLRKQGLSYFSDENGNRQEVGSYPNNSGFSLSIGYYLPIKKVRGLSAGLLVNSGQTGTQPSEGGYAEGYFFNFLNFGLGLQYYPFATNNLYIKGEFGMGSVFTKNRFVNAEGEQDFVHHFGIGLEAGGAIGYTFTPFTNKRIGLYVEGLYHYYATRVEVSGVGNDPWQFGAIHIAGGISF
jgi:hypothetical protein